MLINSYAWIYIIYHYLTITTDGVITTTDKVVAIDLIERVKKKT